MFGEGDINHWAGLIDAGVVLLLLGLWVLLDDTRSWLRQYVTAAGGALLLYAVGGALSRASFVGFIAGYRGFFDEGASRRVIDLGLAGAGCVLGVLLVAYLGRTTTEDDDLDDDLDEDGEEAPAPEPVSLPTSAWSRTEVLGTQSHWDEHDEHGPEPEPRPRRRNPLADWWNGDIRPSRGVAAPVIAAAVGIALPVASGSFGGQSSLEALTSGGDLGGLQIAHHALAGLGIGGAVLGVAVGLDVWERRLAAAAFVLAALGAGLTGAVLEPLRNEFWTIGGIGLACGLVPPAALRVLRARVRLSASAVAVGVLTAILLVAAQGLVTARIATSNIERSVGDDD